jgi:hypothetical protein
MDSKHPISLVMAIPNHPWTKATPDAAQVRIAMTVATAGEYDGVLNEVAQESALDTDEPQIELASRFGKINSDLTNWRRCYENEASACKRRYLP